MGGIIWRTRDSSSFVAGDMLGGGTDGSGADPEGISAVKDIGAGSGTAVLVSYGSQAGLDGMRWNGMNA